VNLWECVRMRAMGRMSFAGCFNLRPVGVPPLLRDVDFSQSGLPSVDFRGSMVTGIDIQGCPLLERLVATRACTCLCAESCISLRRLTCGRKLVSGLWERDSVPREIRFESSQSCLAAVLRSESVVVVIGEVAALGVFDSRPSLPC
jgi:hypothetical protein